MKSFITNCLCFENCSTNNEPAMPTSSLESPRRLSLARIGVSSALAMLLLGASTPRLAAQSYNFNSQSDAAWTRVDIGAIPAEPPYPTNIYSFPTNPAGPAGNYAYRIQVPVYTEDPMWYFFGIGGSYLASSTYGNVNDSTGGRFVIGSDLIAWNTTWPDMEIGIAWDTYFPDLHIPTAYFAGWGPNEKTLGVGVVINGVQQIGLIGLVKRGSTVLQTDHQYRMVASSHDGNTFLAQIFDLAQPNSPWQSVITYDTSLGNNPANGGGGFAGLVGAALGQIPTGQGADATWDNYSEGAPDFVDPSGNVPAIMPATVTDLAPPPAGQAEYYPTVSIGFMNRDTGVNSSSNPNDWIKLYLDGVQIPNNQLTIDPTNVYKLHNNDAPGGYIGPQAPYPTNFSGATVSYRITSLLAPGWHTNTVVFEDDQTANGQNVLHTNTWSWMALSPSISLYASNSLPVGSLSLRGFDARLVESLSTSSDPAVYTNYANINAHAANPAWFTVLPDGLDSAFAVLNYQYTVSYAATNLVPVVNFNRNNEPVNGIAATNFPGLCLPAADARVNSFAVDVQAYLQLTAGVHRFHVNSDDAAAIYSGTNPKDTSAVLYQYNGVANADFDFLVPADGLYPIRIVMEEGMGGAYLCLYSVDLLTGVTTLVNAAGSVPAFYPLVCKSSTSVKGPYTVVTATNAAATASALCESGTGPIVNQTVTGGTNTVALPSSARYYRLEGPRKTGITGMTKSGSTLAIPYTY